MHGSAQRRATHTLSLIAALALSLAACGGESRDADAAAPSPSDSASSTSPSETTSSPAATDEPGGAVIPIVFKDGNVSPNGKRVDARVGEAITLEVTADEAGELHVHATPEQELEYAAGTTELELTVDKPGVVDVESHDLDVVVVQLEVH